MTRLAKLACSALVAAAFFASAPAKAQFAGIDENQMQQFAPMLEMMKKQMGKKKFGELMKSMGPMMEKMQSGGMGSMDMGQMMSMLGSMKGLMGGGGSGGAGRHPKAKSRAMPHRAQRPA
jgi:hypothetical protein